MKLKEALTNSVGRKFVMAFTGIFLILFLIVHASINAFIFFNDGGVLFEKVAHFMSHNWIMRILELGLFIGFAIHIVQGLMLARMNKKARPVQYSTRKYIKEITWQSRFMPILGVLILLYLIMHLGHFWIHTKDELYLGGAETPTLYERMQDVFTNWIWFIAYMIGLWALLNHLLHGFQSAFRSLGINNRTWTPIIKTAGIIYSWVIVLLFASMPIAFMAGWLK